MPDRDQFDPPANFLQAIFRETPNGRCEGMLWWYWVQEHIAWIDSVWWGALTGVQIQLLSPWLWLCGCTEALPPFGVSRVPFAATGTPP